MSSKTGAADGRVVVVSNRLPLTLKRAGDGWRTERSTGGLATAMGPILARSEGIWIGWSGEASGVLDDKRQKLLDRWRERERYIAVDIPPATAHHFYEGFANQTLWPLFHQFPMMTEFNPDGWRAYVEANQLFCDVLVEHLREEDIVWIHDYQLLLLPQLLRQAVPDARIGFFLHIPWPAADVFRILPHREEILQGLLGADYLAFHTHGYLQHFRASLLRILGLESQMDRVEVGGRFARLEALPIGIAPEEFTDLLDGDAATSKHLAELRQRFTGQQIMLAVDRLDYTKGIPERLRTFHRLLDKYPELRGKVVLIQVAVPSRERISSYKELRREVDALVGRTNGVYGTAGWTPIVYLRRAIPKAELVALYAAADVGWVTPLRDGMNLVAKEFIACKRGESGVLVLSEFAGAAAEMGEAFLVNPYDEERTADVLERALQLPAAERRERMSALFRRVQRNNVFAWGERFLNNLYQAAADRSDRPSDKPEPLPVATVVQAYREAQSRLLLLDYDGTLVPYANRPQDASPPASLVNRLTRLAAHPANCVALVSGRSRADIEAWFGRIHGLWLAAEHGAIMRSPDTKKWETPRLNYPVDWKAQIYPVLEHFTDRTPGSFIEEKEYSLVWHYRMSDPEFGEWLANELVANLEEMLAHTELRAVRGAKSVEVRLIWANKGEFVKRISEVCPDQQFLLGAGDDRTDEEIFERLPADAWTIHVGRRRSLARFQLRDHADMWNLLESFAEADSSPAFDSLAAKATASFEG
ncbi:MAG TPA: bifunctional alpha,alpha-trehalose-phosphate synthase (UDP-forming)/trehalose-phosphatase [Pyrinomonadaceae bacterium]|jgi:trehalose 6-phosphate synthase/phosphatase